MRNRISVALGGVTLLALALAGCATPATDPGGEPEVSGSAPAPGSEGVPEWDVDAGWLAGGSMIALVTYGSSSCVPELVEAAAGDGALVVSLRERSQSACTADLAPQPLGIAVPAGIDPSAGVRIQVTMGERYTDLDLAAYSGGAVEEFTPSAGWIDDDALAILTWGSSSCVPEIESADVASPASVVVRFVTPAADQVCTMDLAPQLTVATIDGEVSEDATLTLSAGGIAGGESIPIA